MSLATKRNRGGRPAQVNWEWVRANARRYTAAQVAYRYNVTVQAVHQGAKRNGIDMLSDVELRKRQRMRKGLL